MSQELRKSGIEFLGDLPWGTHFCQFYETKKDLLEVLVPYFKAGLENNEFCLWIICDPLTRESAIQAMRQAIQNFDQYLTEQKIEILPHVDWYLKGGRFSPQEIINGWNEKLRQAIARGFDGMRVNGNETWLAQKDWDDFMDYERELNHSLQDKQMIVFCTYPLAKTTAKSILDVAHSHERAISKRRGHWEILEDPGIKANLKKRNYELEQKVTERTQTIAKTVHELKIEIAEKEMIAEELKRSELRYRTLIEQASDAIIITDERGHLTEVNASFCKLVGYPEKDLIGMDITLLIEPEHLKAQPLRFDLLIEGESLYRERQMMKKDGTVLQIEEHVKMLGDKRILAVVRDVTERKQAEDALRRSEDRNRLIIDTIPTMAWTIQPDGIVDFANQRWLDYTGVEEMGDPLRIIHPEDLPRVMEKWQASMAAGEKSEDEMRLRRADGEYRWFLVRTAPLHDEQGNLVKWYGVSTDIEDSRRAENELRLAYQSLSYHVENTPLAVIEWDKDLYIKRWSARAEEIFGWKVSEAIGKNMHGPDFPIIYEEDSKAVNKTAGDLMKGMVDRNINLNRNRTKDGNVIYCEWYNSVLRDERGNVITILSLVHNVTKRIKAEETLKQSYEEIRRLTEHLQNIREEERTHIARDIHDELGGQLTVMKMDASWLSKKLVDEKDGVKQRIGNLMDIMGTMVKSVRRISSELRPSSLDNLGLTATIEWHLEEFEKRSGIKALFNKQKEELDIPDSLKNGLFRIFQESLTNVARHSWAKHVKVELLQKDGQVTLSIVDDGKGFDQEKAAKMKTLGILGMKERTAMMGGSYGIKTKPGLGTTVTVILPLKTGTISSL
jgi:PAS domain S-box-containing protein